MNHETPLHMRLADRSPEQVRDEFPHDLAHDLLEQGMSAEDAENAKAAAAVVMELCGIRPAAPMRRRAATDATRDRQSRGARLP